MYCIDDSVVVVDWSGPEDPENPFNWPTRRKWFATSLALLATFSSIINGSIITTAHLEIDADFHIDETAFPHSYWPVTSWALGGGLFSLALLPLMEDFGVRPAFLSTYFVFTCFLIPIGFAQNFATLIICRFFSGGCASLLANTAAGVASNVFEGYRERTIPMSSYIVFYMCGSSLGPVVGAAVLQYLPWRWTGHIETIWTAVLLPLFFLAMPESRGSVILEQRAKRLRSEGKNAYTREELQRTPVLDIIKNSVQRPLYMLCSEPVLVVATLWSAFSFGVIYLFTQSVELVFTSLYGWDAIQAGYVQVSLVVGEILGWLFCLSTDHWYYSSVYRNTESPNTPIPEARLYSAILGGFVGVSGGMFVYAWTSFSSVTWGAPVVGLIMVGAGSTTVVVGICHYVVVSTRSLNCSCFCSRLSILVSRSQISCLRKSNPVCYLWLEHLWIYLHQRKIQRLTNFDLLGCLHCICRECNRSCCSGGEHFYRFSAPCRPEHVHDARLSVGKYSFGHHIGHLGRYSNCTFVLGATNQSAQPLYAIRQGGRK